MDLASLLSSPTRSQLSSPAHTPVPRTHEITLLLIPNAEACQNKTPEKFVEYKTVCIRHERTQTFTYDRLQRAVKKVRPPLTLPSFASSVAASCQCHA
jgi:hypothetical protein